MTENTQEQEKYVSPQAEAGEQMHNAKFAWMKESREQDLAYNAMQAAELQTLEAQGLKPGEVLKKMAVWGETNERPSALRKQGTTEIPYKQEPETNQEEESEEDKKLKEYYRRKATELDRLDRMGLLVSDKQKKMREWEKSNPVPQQKEDETEETDEDEEKAQMKAEIRKLSQQLQALTSKLGETATAMQQLVKTAEMQTVQIAELKKLLTENNPSTNVPDEILKEETVEADTKDADEAADPATQMLEDAKRQAEQAQQKVQADKLISVYTTELLTSLQQEPGSNVDTHGQPLLDYLNTLLPAYILEHHPADVSLLKSFIPALAQLMDEKRETNQNKS